MRSRLMMAIEAIEQFQQTEKKNRLDVEVERNIDWNGLQKTLLMLKGAERITNLHPSYITKN